MIKAVPNRQDEDGTPHFCYFDKPTQLSFVWDGKSSNIQVAHGGYGEPVADQIPVNRLVDITNSKAWLVWFKTLCEAYVDENKDRWKEEFTK